MQTHPGMMGFVPKHLANSTPDKTVHMVGTYGVHIAGAKKGPQ